MGGEGRLVGEVAMDAMSESFPMIPGKSAWLVSFVGGMERDAEL
jgi:hypothetical protein